MANQALTILQNAVAPSLLKQESNGLSPQIKNLSDRVQKAAGECLREYQQLCRHFSNGARDPELMEILFFSQKESKLLSQMSFEEKALYNRICESSIAAIYPDLHHRAVQSSQQTAILKSFPTIVPVPGDGNCGLHAFTYGFVDQMNAYDAAKLKAKILKLGPELLGSNEAFVLDRLNQGRSGRDLVRDLVNDSKFMMALSKVFRTMGYNNIPKYYKTQIDEMGNSDEVRSIMSNLIPKKDGQWVDHEGLICLGRIFGKKVCVLREMSRGHVVVGSKENPDIVINHSGNHFTARQRIR